MQKRKKLKLRRNTIRKLSDAQSQEVAGGTYWPTFSDNCSNWCTGWACTDWFFGPP